MDDHERGCEGRTYTCTCGYDDTIATRIETLEAQNARLREALGWFSVAVGGNPIVVDRMLSEARAALKGGE